MTLTVLRTSLRLEPDLKENKISGTTSIIVSLTNPDKLIILHANTIEITNLTVIQSKINVLESFSFSPQTEELFLNLKRAVKGKLVINISFISIINKEYVGFYKSNERDNGDSLLVTQFYETEARKAFPCFDLPNFKSVFDVEVIIDNDLNAVFNTDVLHEEPFSEAKKLIHFIETPKMPTAILFFGIGKLDILEESFNGKKFRFIAEMNKSTAYGSFALHSLVESFTFSQKYFKFPYPLSKLDLFALNNFYGGAMENFGIISILETLSLYYENVTSIASQDASIIVIAHETAHQWFGDLVSPSSYKKFIWLNESFATYFSYKVIKKLHPSKLIWEKFLKDIFVNAMHRDSFFATVPIELPGDAIQAIDVLSSPIIYNKGGSILRQLASYIGSKNFRLGIRLYLEKYAYSNASSQDLWQTITNATKLPVTEIMDSWVNQPGYPYVFIERSPSKLFIRQKRFLFKDRDNFQSWIIPIKLKFYSSTNIEKQNFLVKEPLYEYNLGNTNKDQNYFYFINSDVSGFYRVLYDNFNLESLIKNKNKLSSKQKFHLISDYFAFFLAGKSSLDKYFSLLLSFKDEYSFLVVSTILSQLKFLKLHLNEEFFSKIVAFGSEYLQSILDYIRLEPSNNDSDQVVEIRSNIIPLLYYYNIKEVIDFGLKNYNKIMNGEKIQTDIINGILFIGAKEIGDFSKLSSKYEHESREEMKNKYLMALAAISYTDTSEVFNFINKNLSERHYQSFFISLSENPSLKTKLFGFLKDHFDIIAKKNFLVQQLITYFVLINSKYREYEIIEFIEKQKATHLKFEKIFDLIREELSVYQVVYNIRSLEKQSL